ncbi:glycosyltransferase family 2 protein [Planctomicrobium sp. SH661]|uniref:glycosyltransferase family 2 protein n=1 Tax=Planctomicrobium sp. SH661 TaxID=3448124 RepID=UPI003F5BEED6
MSSTPQISVVIPAYHAVKTIANTLQSVLNQTVPPQEIIVIDDGSKDETAAFVRSHFPQVRVVTQKNAGPSAARNHGIRLAQNPWIALLDSDDSWLPNKLERQIQEIADDVALIHTHTVGDNGKNERNITFDELWEHNYIGTSTVLMNKEVCQSVGGFPEDRALVGAEDYHLWLRIAATGKRIVTVREELTLYTPAEGNLSAQISRVVKAELINTELIGKSCGLAPERIERKRAAVLDEYARALFWMRDLPLARKYYRELLNYRCTPRNVGYWLATYLPPALLNRNRAQVVQAKNKALLQAATVGLPR